MAKIVADISMSLDGFVTGPEPDLEHGLGRGGEPLTCGQSRAATKSTWMLSASQSRQPAP